jgi:hypothetical protein
MIDSTSVRAHQQAATAKKGGADADHCLGRSRGGLTTKIHAGRRCARAPDQARPNDRPGMTGRSPTRYSTNSGHTPSCWPPRHMMPTASDN